MINTGKQVVITAVRGVDDLGRIVIPKGMREALNIKEGDKMEITPHENGIFIKKVAISEDDK